jgi:hypothetical protein
MYGYSKRTTQRHIKKIRFQRIGLGKYYTEQEVCLLAILMGFDLSPKFKERHTRPLRAKK